MKVPVSVLLTGILCITAIEAFALYKGIDGAMLRIYIAAVAGILGWTLPQIKTK